ncbi:MAG: SpaH/EbpB family LPXTG-anchored major pilin [Bifidobacteriaceae bacterium]|jgi:fimbrial isopeptide formation D2 family protein/LPXTG-motif cell wall-anchored protein|nr:SpaH/EbpB family LPXTG-anchored major pilin [Bifidobacteriaceae bacterium]
MDKTQVGRSWKHRAVALMGAAGLIFAGLFGGAGVAAAAPSSVQPTDPSAPESGSLTLHKLDGAETGDVNNGMELVDDAGESTVGGEPLSGVTFTATAVLGTVADPNDPDSAALDFNLTTAEGWQNLKTSDVANRVNEIKDGGFRIGNTPIQRTNEKGIAVFSNLPLGLYLIEEIGSGLHDIVTKTAPFLVTIPLNLVDENGDATNQWLYDVHAYPKNNTVEDPVKKAEDPDDHLGGVIGWSVTQTLPALNDTDELIRFEMDDTLDPKLEYVESTAVVSVAGVEISSEKDFNIVDPSATNGNKLSVIFTEQGVKKLDEALKKEGSMGLDIVLTFKTKVLEVGKYENKAETFVNENDLKSEVQSTEWGKLIISKVDGNTDESLNGAVFEIYDDVSGAKGESPIGNGTVAGGTLEFGLLWIGNNGDPQSRDYWIVETVAPAGYVLDATPRKVTISANGGTYITRETITNYPPIIPGLPLTGSAGTVVIIGIGIAMLVTAGGLIAIKRHRMRVSAQQ